MVFSVSHCGGDGGDRRDKKGNPHSLPVELLGREYVCVFLNCSDLGHLLGPVPEALTWAWGHCRHADGLGWLSLGHGPQHTDHDHPAELCCGQTAAG